MIVAVLLMLMAFVFLIYEVVSRDELYLLPDFVVARIIYSINSIYQTTRILDPLWNFAPQLNRQNMFTEENLKFIAIAALLFLGGIMRDSGKRLSNRIKKRQEEVEERGWEEDMSGRAPADAEEKTVISISAKDNWYSRPLGIVALTVIAGYIVLLLGSLSGF